MPQTDKNPQIAIIGAGFSGLMTAVNLIKGASVPVTINIINDKATFGKGAAYSTDSNKHLLNVPAAKMSAFGEEPTHFLDWVTEQPAYKSISKDALAKTFLPRKLYSQYINSIWEKTFANKADSVTVNVIHDIAFNIEKNLNQYSIQLKSNPAIHADYIILATGNEAPGNPTIPNTKFYESKSYVRNPWLTDISQLIKKDQNILIIGNGLTTVDQVISIMESGYTGTIHTISPRGFSILPHRFSHVEYKDFINEIKEPYTFDQLFKIGLKHFRFLYKLGMSAEPIVDSMRPHTQRIWQSLSQQDKETFLQKFRPTWNTIRHRVAPHLYDYIQGLRIKGKLLVHRGSLIDIFEDNGKVTVHYRSRNTKQEQNIEAGLVINCTGPHTDISRSEAPFLKSLVSNGTIKPDALKIGMDVNADWNVIDKDGNANPTIFTIGGSLRGLLWETTAVPELKMQSAKLAKQILEEVKKAQSPISVSR